jgi:hypothetical protein
MTTECKHRWEQTPHRDNYHYRCARCGNAIWTTLKEKQSDAQA